eukprot:scaffold17307_cov63-Phaeocystis_antarctica.AAC.8
MHAGPPYGVGGAVRRSTARASTAGRARRTRPSWPWCSPRDRSGAACRKGNPNPNPNQGCRLGGCLRSLSWPPGAGWGCPSKPNHGPHLGAAVSKR